MSVGSIASQIWLKREVEERKPNLRTSCPYPYEAEAYLQNHACTVTAGRFITWEHHPAFMEQQGMLVIGGVYQGIITKTLEDFDGPNGHTNDFQQNPGSMLGGVHKDIFREGGTTLDDFAQLTATTISGELHTIIVSTVYTPLDEFQQTSFSVIGGSHNDA